MNKYRKKRTARDFRVPFFLIEGKGAVFMRVQHTDAVKNHFFAKKLRISLAIFLKYATMKMNNCQKAAYQYQKREALL